MQVKSNTLLIMVYICTIMQELLTFLIVMANFVLHSLVKFKQSKFKVHEPFSSDNIKSLYSIDADG